MAVVNRNEQASANASNKKGYAEPVEVNLDKILAMGAVGPKRALDANEDAWERSAPIPPGRYTIKAFLSKENPKMGFYDDAKKEPWFTLGLECKIASSDPEVNNTTVFAGVSTRINQRKNISTAAGLIAKMGFKLPAEASDIDVVKLLRAALLKERPLDVEIDWKAGYMEADNKWVNCANTYEDFPDNPEGGKDWVIKVEKKDKSKEECRARLFVAHWYGKDEVAVAKSGTLPQAKVNGVAMPALEDEAVDGLGGMVANPTPTTVAPTKANAKPPAVSDDDALAALLDG